MKMQIHTAKFVQDIDKERNIDTYYLEQKTFFPDVCHSALVGLLFFLAFLSHETSSQGSRRSIRVE